MKLAIATSLVASAAAFAPSTSKVSENRCVPSSRKARSIAFDCALPLSLSEEVRQEDEELAEASIR